MPLVTSTEMFKKAYNGGYAVGAFNVNNMEIVQGITEACREEKAPVILQVSKGARAYANHTYLVKLVEAAVIECQMGCNFRDYLMGIRMKKAKDLICGAKNYAMIQISQMVGYQDYAQFSKMYKKFHGRSPMADLQNHKKAQKSERSRENKLNK